MDTLSKSDPQVFIHYGKGKGKMTEIGATEVIKDNLNPKFATAITLDYYFEETQNLRFTVVDVDSKKRRMEDQDLIGTVECTLADIVGAKGSQITRKIESTKRKESGSLIITAEEIHDIKMTITFNFSGKGLEKKDFFGKSDPYLVISKSREDGSWIKVHESEVIKNTLDPNWQEFSISIQQLNNGGNPDFIGRFQTTLDEIVKGKRQFPLINPEKVNKKKYEHSGIIYVDKCDLKREYSFLEYIQGGCQITLMVGIDFTASNGNPQLPTSLHYFNPDAPNEYEKGPYDSNQMIPVYGFGAKIPPTNQVSHCFPLNGNPSNPEVYGVRGILDVYHQSIANVTLFGPTNFSGIIKTAAYVAGQHCTQQDQQYLILLMITDGEITDMEQTIEAIIDASKLPMSIVIVGVGDADFGKMKILDSDNKVLRLGNKTAEADIVQFVPFREYKEIPGQLVGHFKRKKIIPNPPPFHGNPTAPPATPTPQNF